MTERLSVTLVMWSLEADYDLRLARYAKARQIERAIEPLPSLQPVT